MNILRYAAGGRLAEILGQDLLHILSAEESKG